MDEAWERAVETALDAQRGGDSSAPPPRSLTLDGVVKCLHGKLPAPVVLERLGSLEHLSIANIGLSTLEKFPKLRNLQRLILSDNRIAGGLEHLVAAGLDSLRDLDLSNNRIQFLEDLEPLSRLRLVSLDLYECPVTRIKDYRSKVFGVIRSLKYLDKMDADENERPETDDDDDDDEEDDEEDDDDEDEEEDDEDPGSGEVDGEEQVRKEANGFGGGRSEGGVLDVDEDDESDADEETDTHSGAGENGAQRSSHGNSSNGFRVAVARSGVEEEDGEEEDGEADEVDEFAEEFDEDDGEDEDVIENNNNEGGNAEDAMEEDGDEEEDDYEDEEEVEDEGDDEEPVSNGRLMSAEGEIDAHEQGEEDENVESGEEDEEAIDEERDFDDEVGEDEEDSESEFMVQPIRPPANPSANGDINLDNEDSEEEVDDDADNDNLRQDAASLPSSSKRKRDGGGVDGDNVRHSKHH